jgi:hypothetical protein
LEENVKKDSPAETENGASKIARRKALKRIAMIGVGMAVGAVVATVPRTAEAGYGVSGDYTDSGGYGVSGDYTDSSGYGVSGDYTDGA